MASIPESYRHALSGVRGRLVEEDGRPIGNLKVELLEFAFGGFFGDLASSLGGGPHAIPDLALAEGVSDEAGRFELRGALPPSFHGIGIDLGGARGTLRFIDRTLNSGTIVDLGDIVLAPYVTWTGIVVDEDDVPVSGARVRATILPPIVFQPGVADAGRLAAVMGMADSGSARPELYGIPAAMRAWEQRLPFPTTSSRADGTFELAGVPQGLASLIVDREGFTATWSGPQATARRNRDIGSITLSRGRAITGRVVDAAGDPVPGAELVGGAVISMASVVIAFAAQTDADGRFAIEHLAESSSEFIVAARRAPIDDWTFTPSVDGSAPLTITLPAVAALDVLLTKKGGGVVPAADLYLRPNRADLPLTMSPPCAIPAERLVKVEDGHLRILDFANGDYRLIGHARGFAPAFATIEFDSEQRSVTLEFTEARELPVRVVAQEGGEPVEYAEVSVTKQDDRTSPPFLVRRTDAHGMVRLPDLPADAVVVRVFHPAFAPGFRSVDLAEWLVGAEPIEFVLGPGATLHGYIHEGG
ncbi:MAG: carboxypeptidase regulatory-like domain-containing protein, partial [Planctomycetes bacterium]|nr:carboxypeptidase regulatory-like domain-containing protein [Planctomycetota bacterium]